MKEDIKTLRKQSNRKYLGFDYLSIDEIFINEFLKLDANNIKYVLQNLGKYVGSYELKQTITMSNTKRNMQYEKEFITKDKKKKVVFDIYVNSGGGIVIKCLKVEMIPIEKSRNIRFNTQLGIIEEENKFYK